MVTNASSTALCIPRWHFSREANPLLRVMQNRFSSRVTRTRTHTYTHANSLATEKEAERLPTEALPAAAGLRLPSASLTQRGFPRFARFQNFLFRMQGISFPPSGAAPPRPKGERGLLWMLLRSSSCRLLRSLRGNGWKPAPNVGGVGHSCDLPLGHSCDLPMVAYRPQKRFTCSRYETKIDRYEVTSDLSPAHI